LGSPFSGVCPPLLLFFCPLPSIAIVFITRVPCFRATTFFQLLIFRPFSLLLLLL
jgi:hypothetical protein